MDKIKVSEIRAKFPMYEDMPDEALIGAIRRKFYADIPMNDFVQKIDFDTERERLNPTKGNSFWENARIGVGKGMTDVARGIGQLTGQVSTDDIKESRRLDAPLMETGGGMVGSVVGQAAPAMLVPGAQGILGAGLTGAGLGFIGPAESTSERLANTGFGGVGGAAVAGASKALGGAGKAVYKAVSPYLPGGTARIEGKAFRAIAGDKVDDVIRALENSKQIVPGSLPTAGEASVAAKSPQFAALQDILSRGFVTDKYAARDAAQQSARQGLLSKIAGDEDALKAALQIRDDITGPMREQALSNANIAGVYIPRLQKELDKKMGSLGSALQSKGKLDTFAAQQENLANTWTPIPGLPRFPGRYAPHMENVKPALEGADLAGGVAGQRSLEAALKRMQLESVSAEGHEMLKAKPIIQSLSSTMNSPGNKTNTTLQSALGEIKDLISKSTNKNGVIDSRDLYTIRKTEAGNVIRKYADANKDWDQRFTAGLLRDVQGLIDDSIEGAGGSNWKNYLQTYSRLSERPDQMKIGQFLQDKLTGAKMEERPAVFLNAMRTEPTTINKSLNFKGEKISDFMRPDQMKSLTSISDDLLRQEELSRLSKAGIQDTQRQLQTLFEPVDIPGYLDAKVTATRWLLNKIQGGGGTKEMRQMAIDMLDPQRVAELMKAAAPKDRLLVENVLSAAKQGDIKYLAQHMPREVALSMVTMMQRGTAASGGLGLAGALSPAFKE